MKKKKRVKIEVQETNGNIRGRYRLHEDEAQLIDDYRRFHNASVEQGIDPSTVKHGWFKSKESSLFAKNPSFKTPEQIGFELVQKEIIDELKNYSPKYPTIKRKKSKESHLLIVDPADIHIGKLCTAYETGTEYNQNIAVKRVLEGVKGLLDKSNGFNIDKIIFVAGNDILHTDNTKRETKNGTAQDTDGMWYDNFLTAKQLYVDIIEMLMQIADVLVIFCPSNHDYQSGFFLAQTIEAHFRLSKNVTFNCSIAHRKYAFYGTNLLGFTHGDGSKEANLGSLMSIEAKENWGFAEYRYFYTHHLHHKQSKDYINVSVETLRSPSPSDSWHNTKGFKHTFCAIELFVHSKEHGQVARITHLY